MITEKDLIDVGFTQHKMTSQFNSPSYYKNGRITINATRYWTWFLDDEQDNSIAVSSKEALIKLLEKINKNQDKFLIKISNTKIQKYVRDRFEIEVPLYMVYHMKLKMYNSPLYFEMHHPNDEYFDMDGEIDENDKVLTYHINAGDGELITTDLNSGLEYEGCLQEQIEYQDQHNNLIPDDDGVLFTFTVSVKKTMTQAEVDNLPEKQ